MSYSKSIRVTYSIKNEDGFMVEKRQKFVTTKDAFVFIKLLRQNINLVGKPLMEYK